MWKMNSRVDEMIFYDTNFDYNYITAQLRGNASEASCQPTQLASSSDADNSVC